MRNRKRRRDPDSEGEQEAQPPASYMRPQAAYPAAFAPAYSPALDAVMAAADDLYALD